MVAQTAPTGQAIAQVVAQNHGLSGIRSGTLLRAVSTVSRLRKHAEWLKAWGSLKTPA